MKHPGDPINRNSFGHHTAGGQHPLRFVEVEQGEYAHACRNQFGCRAGSLPLVTEADMSCDTCQACAILDDGKRAKLLPRRDIIKAIECCPVCFWCLGARKHDGKNDVIRYPTVSEVAKHPHWNENNSISPCSVCGFKPNRSIRFFQEASKQIDQDTDDNILLNQAVLEVLQAAQGRWPSETLLMIARDISRDCHDRNLFLPQLFEEIHQSSSTDVYASRVLRQRLENIRNILVEERILRTLS